MKLLKVNNLSQQLVHRNLNQSPLRCHKNNLKSLKTHKNNQKFQILKIRTMTDKICFNNCAKITHQDSISLPMSSFHSWLSQKHLQRSKAKLSNKNANGTGSSLSLKDLTTTLIIRLCSKFTSISRCQKARLTAIMEDQRVIKNLVKIRLKKPNKKMKNPPTTKSLKIWNKVKTNSESERQKYQENTQNHVFIWN